MNRARITTITESLTYRARRRIRDIHGAVFHFIFDARPTPLNQLSWNERECARFMRDMNVGRQWTDVDVEPVPTL